MATKITYPDWLERLDGLPRHRAELDYLLRLVALHHNSTGSLPKLSLAMGLTRTRLHIHIREGRITDDIANRLLSMGPSAAGLGLSRKKLGEFVG